MDDVFSSNDLLGWWLVCLRSAGGVRAVRMNGRCKRRRRYRDNDRFPDSHSLVMNKLGLSVSASSLPVQEGRKEGQKQVNRQGRRHLS
ncbi:hypothetical protein BDV12DRAFT_160782 [Aspergillus spectabilis]